MHSDAELVTNCLKGEKEAFACLVRRYERGVRAIAIGILADGWTAEDAVQESFLKAYSKLGSLKKRDSFGSWLFKIARRCSLDLLSKNDGQVNIGDEEIADRSSNEKLDEPSQVMLAGIARLNKSEQQVVMLRYFAGNSVRQVAEISGRSVGTVTKQLSRAHGRLREILKGVEK